MFHWIALIAYCTVIVVCLLFVVGLALILWEDVDAERRYRKKGL